VKWARTLVAALAAVTFPLGLALAVYLTSAESMPTVPQPVSAASASVSRTPAVPSSRDDKGGGRTGDSAPTVTSGGGGGSSSGGGGGSDSSGGGHGSGSRLELQCSREIRIRPVGRGTGIGIT